MAYPFFLEIGDLIIARIRRPHITPSPRFGHNSHQFFGELNALISGTQGGLLSDAYIGRSLLVMGMTLILSDEDWDGLRTELEIRLADAKLGQGTPMTDLKSELREIRLSRGIQVRQMADMDFI